MTMPVSILMPVVIYAIVSVIVFHAASLDVAVHADAIGIKAVSVPVSIRVTAITRADMGVVIVERAIFHAAKREIVTVTVVTAMPAIEFAIVAVPVSLCAIRDAANASLCGCAAAAVGRCRKCRRCHYNTKGYCRRDSCHYFFHFYPPK